MEAVFRIDENTLTWGDLLDLEEKGANDKRLMTRIVSKTLIKLEGVDYTPETAYEAMRGMSIDKITQLFGAFGEAMKASRDKSSPPANSGG